MRRGNWLCVCRWGAMLTLVARAGAQPAPLLVDSRHSQVEVAVQATAHSFTATLTDYHAAMRVDDDGRVAAVEFTFHFADLTTANRLRDRAMQAWQQTEKHPDGSFTLSSLRWLGNDRFLARGELALHGSRRTIEFPVAILVDHARYAFDGTVKLDTRDYGLPAIRKLGWLRVNPEVQVSFHLQATAQRGACPFSPPADSEASLGHGR